MAYKDKIEMSRNGAQEKLTRLWAGLEWVWVIANPIDDNRDSLLVMEDEPSGFRFIPAFESREAAETLKPKLCGAQPSKNYEVQAINLEEVARFAVKEHLDIMLLGEDGRILAQMSVQPAGGGRPLH